MRFLCLAYGNEKDWNALSEAEREELLAQDDVLRQRGDLVASVGEVTTVRAWDGKPSTTGAGVAESPLPLAGFSVIEARDLDEAITLIAYTPCARARGAVEVRPVLEA